MELDGFIQIGTIINSHGLKGEVKVLPQTSDPELFLELEELILIEAGGQSRHKIENARETNQNWLIKLEGIDNVDDVKPLKGRGLYTEESNVRPLDDDEFFIHDLLEAEVYATDGQFLGTIVNYFEAGPQGICEVEGKQGRFLFPTSAEILVDVIPPGRVVINPVPDLLDLNKKKR